MAAPQQDHVRGIMLSCAGFTAWAASDACIKWAGETLTSATVMALSVCCSACCTLLLAARSPGGLSKLRTKNPVFHLLRALVCVVTFYACIEALKHLPLTSFYMIVFLSPLFIAVLERIVLREGAGLIVALATLFGFCGILVATQAMQQDAAAEAMAATYYGIAAAIINALFYSVVVVMTRYARHENNYVLTLWPDALIFPAALGIMVWQGDYVYSLSGIVLAALSGVFGCAGFMLTNASLRLAPAAIVSPYHYTQIISGAILGFLIWRSVPALGVVIGATMVIAAGLVIFRQSKAAAVA